MQFHYKIISKTLSCGQKYFLKFSSGVLFNIGLFYPQNFSWRQHRKFHFKHEHEVYHLQ